MSSAAPIVVLLVVLALVVVLVWAVSRSGGKLIATRNAKLAEIAASLGLQARATSHPHLFAADGTTHAGVPFRISIDRVLLSVRGGGNRWLLRLAGRPLAPRAALLV